MLRNCGTIVFTEIVYPRVEDMIRVGKLGKQLKLSGEHLRSLRLVLIKWHVATLVQDGHGSCKMKTGP